MKTGTMRAWVVGAMLVGGGASGDIAYSNFDPTGGYNGGHSAGLGWFEFDAADGFDQFGITFEAEAGGVLRSASSVLGYSPGAPITTASISIWRALEDGTPIELLDTSTAEVEVSPSPDRGLTVFEFDGSAEIVEGGWYSVVLTNPNLQRSLRVSQALRGSPAIFVTRAGPGEWDVKPANDMIDAPAFHVEVDPVPAPGTVVLGAACVLALGRRRRD